MSVLYENDFSTPIPAENLMLSTGATYSLVPSANWDGIRGCAKFTPHINPWQNYFAFGPLAYTPSPVVFIRYCVLFGSGLNYINASRGFKHLIVTRTSGSGNRAITSLHSYDQDVNGREKFQYMIANNVDNEPPGSSPADPPRYFDIWNTDRPDLDQVEKWICFEVELDRIRNRYCVYATTRDGAWRDERVHEMRLNDTAADFGGIDFLGLFNNGIVAQDATMFFYLSDLKIANEKMGPPRGFVARTTERQITRLVTLPAREVISPEVSVLAKCGAFEVGVTRDAWPDTGSDVIQFYVEVNYGDGIWIVTSGFTSRGGTILDGAGQVITEHIFTVPVWRPRNTARSVRIRTICTVPLHTTIRIEAR